LAQTPNLHCLAQHVQQQQQLLLLLLLGASWSG
jgi:hypothetical protein